MEENELKELKISISRLPNEEINCELLKIIGSNNITGYFKKKENLNELKKIIDKALDDKDLAVRLLSIGYILAADNFPPLHTFENIVQKTHLTLLKYPNDERVYVAGLRFLSILSEKEFFQQHIIREHVLQTVYTATKDKSVEVLKYSISIFKNCFDEFSKSILPKNEILRKSTNFDELVYFVLSKFDEPVLILNTLTLLRQLLNAKNASVLNSKYNLLPQVLAHVYSTSRFVIEYLSHINTRF